MYKWFERYFAFSRRELNGICALGMCLLACWLFIHLYRTWDSREPLDLSAYISQIDHFLATADKHKPILDDVPGDLPRFPTSYAGFDPNSLSVADGRRVGLSDRQVRMIRNYVAKGGRFHRKEDLKKIYAIDEHDYARLEPYIQIAAVETEKKGQEVHRAGPVSVAKKSTDDKGVPLLAIELNAADSVELQQLPGIGPAYASRIVRFRELLGGFHQVSQLLDVYGFDTARFEGLKEYIYVDSSRIERIALNTADYERLRSHPFIHSKLANAIVQYRRQHGPYKALSDLLNIAIMDERIFRNIAPYLTLSDD